MAAIGYIARFWRYSEIPGEAFRALTIPGNPASFSCCFTQIRRKHSLEIALDRLVENPEIVRKALNSCSIKYDQHKIRANLLSVACFFTITPPTELPILKGWSTEENKGWAVRIQEPGKDKRHEKGTALTRHLRSRQKIEEPVSNHQVANELCTLGEKDRRLDSLIH